MVERDAASEDLAELPKRCTLAPEAETLGRELRQLVVGRLFVVDNDVVQVLHIRHAHRRSARAEELQ